MKRENIKRVNEINDKLKTIQEWRDKIALIRKGGMDRCMHLALFHNGISYSAAHYRIDQPIQHMLLGLMETELTEKETDLLAELETL